MQMGRHFGIRKQRWKKETFQSSFSSGRMHVCRGIHVLDNVQIVVFALQKTRRMYLQEFFKLLAVLSLQDGSEDTQGLTKGNRDFSPLVFLIPAMCDLVATSIMYVGLNLTYASSFQMLRGKVLFGLIENWY